MVQVLHSFCTHTEMVIYWTCIR